jgi:hypothetical protein
LFRQQRARINVIGQQIHALELLGVLAPALDRTFSTLSDPTRRAILERLGRGPATISEPGAPLWHLAPRLAEARPHPRAEDLVTTHKHGRTRECRLGSEPLDDAPRWIQTYRGR